ncbi:alkaline shock response membrane anchor protein AmaP [Paenibacillus woosongensis]|uniref:Alkaline shock response membrane anchor protein AmaP n=1 Tax=Paenibacillus woosongensis TaxID=307580 RepID=A0AA95HZ06_9BACL|nr:alkaline shock response membrane anchor protein AmaP [Paenibacillus woosongensis]WHX47459.1 alkaline shock response membrane anchor protein AmaP [Paenibacillus woosongensis]
MPKILDRLLLFIYSLSIGIISVIAILLVTNAVPVELKQYDNRSWIIAAIIVAALLFLLSIRFFYISIKRDRGSLPSIDQRTEYGDIQISVETIENLSYKAASRVRGIRDVKTRIRITDSGLEIIVRALVDGETSIPELTGEVQKQVHDHVEEITGIPVSYVSVYIANLVQSPAIKSRVE